MGEIANVVDFASDGSYFNYSFRRGRVAGDREVEDRLAIVNGIPGDMVTVEYYRQPKRFSPDDIVSVSDGTDGNIDLSDYGLTPQGFDYIVNYVEAKVTELIDPVISARKQNEASEILTSINQEPKFSQDHIGVYRGGIY